MRELPRVPPTAEHLRGASRLAERRTEAISYAVLAGSQNLGAMVGAVIGACLTKWYGITDCDFQGLPRALLVGHMVLPLALIPAGYLLLPDYKMGAKPTHPT